MKKSKQSKTKYVVAVVTIVFLLFTGCFAPPRLKSDTTSFIGTWNGKRTPYEATVHFKFSVDGTFNCSMIGASSWGTWCVSNNLFYMNTTLHPPSSDVYTFKFLNNGNYLTLTNTNYAEKFTLIKE